MQYLRVDYFSLFSRNVEICHLETTIEFAGYPMRFFEGLIGDGLSAFVYSRRMMRSSVNMYLCALAFSDITIILTAFFLFFLENMRKHSIRLAYHYAKSAPVMYPLGLTAQTCSVFFTVAAAFDCYIQVPTAQCKIIPLVSYQFPLRDYVQLMLKIRRVLGLTC